MARISVLWSKKKTKNIEFLNCRPLKVNGPVDEVWRLFDVRTAKGRLLQYGVSSKGRVADWNNGKLVLRVLYNDGEGYLHTRVGGRQVSVHKIVMSVFVYQCPAGMQCCHNNGCRDDNDLFNLRWDYPKENQADRKLHGTLNYGRKNREKCPGACKLTENKVRVIRKLYSSGKYPQTELAEYYGVHQPLISYIVNRKAWADVD